MSCNAVTLKPVRFGDTWKGLTQGSFTSDGSAFANPLASMRMAFRDSSGATVLELDTTGGEIVIDDAAAWEFTINPILAFPLSVGIYDWFIKTVDDTGVGETRLYGKIEVLDNA